MSEFPYEDLVFKEPNTGCWLWEGAYTNDYGELAYKHGGRRLRVRAHRVSYEWHYGAIPEGMEILHKCDTPACVNPSHLRIGTHRENMNDMAAKGRQSKGWKHSKIIRAVVAKGGDSRAAKLTDSQVRAIIADPRSQRLIAMDYPVKQQQVSRIKRGLRWSHLRAT